MQITLYVIAKKPESLRNLIIKDQRLSDSGLVASQIQNPKRDNGWSKIHCDGTVGALNISWDANSWTLTCRFVTKNNVVPHEFIGKFMGFLLKNYKSRIKAILMNL